MTTYRERLKAGVHDAQKQAAKAEASEAKAKAPAPKDAKKS